MCLGRSGVIGVGVSHLLGVVKAGYGHTTGKTEFN